MASSHTSTRDDSGLMVTIVDPLTWSRDFSYEVESSILGAAGVELRVPKDSAERDRLLPQADAIISSGIERVDAARIASLDRCVAIQCYSVGMNAVDIEAAAAAGIQVANVNVSTADVADHTMALLLCLERRLVLCSRPPSGTNGTCANYPIRGRFVGWRGGRSALSEPGGSDAPLR